MKVILDTNVFASGIFWNGIPAKILKLWQAGQFILYLTPDIFEEYIRVCQILSKKHSTINTQIYLDLISLQGQIIPDRILPYSICRDPDDDKFIACAISTEAKIIVSGDKDLLDVSSYEDIMIMKPKEFLDKFNSH